MICQNKGKMRNEGGMGGGDLATEDVVGNSKQFKTTFMSPELQGCTIFLNIKWIHASNTEACLNI